MAGTPTVNENLLAARAVGLRYVNDGEPGITRRKSGKGFSYRGPDGAPVRDRETLRRIRALAVPPAWTDVWICPNPRGHIQATGRDARGRKQYRYHALWSQTRDQAKYERTIAFARALPRLRRRVERDLQRRGLPRDKVIAAVIRLLESTLVRVGNEEYAQQNRSYGLTTLRNRHAAVRGTSLKFSFRGKAGVKHSVGVRDRRLARVVKMCQELPGQRLFEYVDEDGTIQPVDSDDVNAYLRDAMGDDFSAKDFRTWAGTVLAARALQELENEVESGEVPLEQLKKGPTKKALTQAIERVAAGLGNTPSVCRKCYIHPAIIDSYMDGTLAESLSRRVARKLENDTGSLRDEERLVLSLLRRRLAAETRAAARATSADPAAAAAAGARAA
jgi:DNA topoisomerase I